MPEFTGRWTGRVRSGAEDDHERFLDGLRTSEGGRLLERCGLTDYRLYQRGTDLEIHFKSAKPSIIAGFLRNKRMWPQYWEFDAPGQEGATPDKPLVFEWTHP